MEFNLADLWERVVDEIPDHEALVCGDRRLTYAETDAGRRSSRTTSPRVGIGAGDHVALYLYNGTEYLEGMLAAFKLRAVPINVNYRYVEDELRYLLDDADACAVVYHREFAPALDAIRGDLPLLRTFVEVADDSGARRRRSTARSTTRPRSPPRRRRATSRARSADDLYILYTGGTTGMPKGVDVARRGHLLRRLRRREPRRRADHRARAGRRHLRPRTGAACPRARSCTAPRTGWRSAPSTPAAPS